MNDWLSIYADPIVKLGIEPPLILTRAVWAGGQRHGAVLWSSDILSTFGELVAMVPQGVHTSLSAISWCTTDVSGYFPKYENHSPYMKQLIVRWYQLGAFCPISVPTVAVPAMETIRWNAHANRSPMLHRVSPTLRASSKTLVSCAANEVWSYGNDTQPMLEKYIRVRKQLKPYIAELSISVTAWRPNHAPPLV